MLLSTNPARSNPKVSVFMLTYNHEQYIKQALDSALAQETDFDVEIVIGEDCSTDNTRAIVADYVVRYPGRIRTLFHDANVGMSRNVVLVLEACTGEYIALLEGDDYWTDPHKLQKQVDFLDAHPDYAISAHNVTVLKSDGQSGTSESLYYSKPPFDTYTIGELAKGNVLPTASCVYRNYFTAGPSPTGVPSWLNQAKIGDFCLHMLTARFGKVKYFHETMGIYRVHQGGVWSIQSELMRNAVIFDTIQLMKGEFDGDARNGLNEYQLRTLSEIADQSQAVMRGSELTEILVSRQDEILSLVKEMYVPFMQSYFTQQQAVHSAEYRYGKQLLAPVRWLLNKTRGRSK